MARQLKNMLRARKAQMLGCGPCECLTLKCRRENEEYCECGGGAVQQIEITPTPGGAPGDFYFLGPRGERVRMMADFEENGVIVGDLAHSNLDFGMVMGFALVSELPEGTRTGGMKVIVDEELANSIIAELESLPEGGKLSAKTSKIILDNYNDVVKNAIVLKNPRFESIEREDGGRNYWFMDLYDYKTDTFLRTYNFDEYRLPLPDNRYIAAASLTDDDMSGFIRALVDFQNENVSWADGVDIDGVVYLPYEYSKTFREGIALTGLHAPTYGSSEYIDVYRGGQDCDYMYDIELQNGVVNVYGLNSDFTYSIVDTVETWEFLPNDCSMGIKVVKENDVYTITTEMEMLQPLVSVLEGLSNLSKGAIFFQCMTGAHLTQDTYGIFWDVYLNPTRAKIASAIETIDARAQQGVMLAECNFN